MRIVDSTRTDGAGNAITERLTIARVVVGGGTTTLTFSSNIQNGQYTVGSQVRYFGDRLTGLFRSADEGSTWTAMTLPNSTDTVEFDANNDGSISFNNTEVFTQTFGIHNGGQGDIHFSLLADPTNPNVVYIGGDRQPVAGSYDRNGDGRCRRESQYAGPYRDCCWNPVRPRGGPGSCRCSPTAGTTPL